MSNKCYVPMALVELKNMIDSFNKNTDAYKLLKKKYDALTAKGAKVKDGLLEDILESSKFMKDSGGDTSLVELDDLIKVKIQDKDLKNVKLQFDEINQTFDFLQKSKSVLAADVIGKYDHELLDEINLFQSFHQSGVRILRYYTKHIETIQQKFKKKGFSSDTVNTLESDISKSVYFSIKESKGPDGFVSRRFNMGYTRKELEEYELSVQGEPNKEKLIQVWKKKEKGFLNYFEENLKKESDNLRLDEVDLEEDLVNLVVATITPSLKHLDEVQKKMNNKEGYYYTYATGTGTFFKDLMNSYIGDPQFVFKHKVFNKGTSGATDLVNHFLTKYEEKMGIELKPNDSMYKAIKSDANKIYSTFLDRKESSKLRSFMKNIMATYYLFKYGRMSFGFGHLTMAMQLASNYLELSSIYRQFDADTVAKINSIENRIGNIGEDTFSFGAGLERERLDDTGVANINKQAARYVKDTTEYFAKKLGVKDEATRNRIGNIVDLTTGEPMMLDGISDLMRRKAAIYKIYQKFGDDVFTMDENTLRSFIKGEYGRIGGAVISSSPLYRETTFTMLDPEKNMYGLKSILMDHFRFLRGWSIAKTLNFGEVQMNGMKGLRMLLSKDPKEVRMGKVFLKEFAGFNLYFTQAIFNSMVLYARIEKTNHDTEENRVPLLGDNAFVSNMTNQIVSFDILLGQEIENIKGIASAMGGDHMLTTEQQSSKTFLEFLKKQTNYMKTMGFFKLLSNHLKYNPGDYTGAVMSARQKLLGGTFRYGKITNDETLADGLYSNDPVSLLFVSPLTKNMIAENESFDISDNLHYIEGKKSNFFLGILDVFSGYFTPSDFYAKDKTAQGVVEKISSDQGLRNLYNNGAATYDIDQLFLDNPLAIDWIYDNIQYKGVGTNGLNSDMSKKASQSDRYNDSSYSFDIMDKHVTDLLEKNGMDIESIVSVSRDEDVSRNIAKLYVSLQVGDNEKMKYLLPYLINKQYLADQKIKKEELGRYTLEEEETLDIKRGAIKKYLDMFDLNNESKGILAQAHIDQYLGDVYPEEISGPNKRSLEKVVNSHIDNLLLATANLPESGTDVKYLTSRIRVNLANMTPKTDQGKKMYADYVLQSLIRTEYSDLPEKEKVARQAAFLLGMTKEGSEIMSDQEEFDKLSEPAKIQLANWYFKTNEKMEQYSSDIIREGVGYKKKTYKKGDYAGYIKKPSFYKSRSPYMSAQRPGFSNQMPEQIPAPLKPYIKPNYQDYTNASMKSRMPRLPQRTLFLPLMKEIQAQMLRVAFSSIYSKKLFNEMQFKKGAPVTKKTRTLGVKRKLSKTKSKPLKKNRKGRVYLNQDGSSYVDFIR